jgi:hypothetical protein
MEGDDMKDQASLMAQMENQDYGRYRDQVGDYNAELDRLLNRYDTERDYDYGKYIDDRNFGYQQGRDEVADKQWQTEFDEAVRQFNHQHKIKTGGSSSGGSSDNSSAAKSTGNKGSYDTHGYTKEEIIALQKAAGITPDGIWGPNTQKAYEAGYSPASKPTGGGGSGFTGNTYSEAVAYMKANGVSSAEASGAMTQSEWQRRKNAGAGSAEVKNYSSYKEYLADYVEYKTSK